MNNARKRLIISSVLGLAGFAVAVWVDWRIALAVFLIQWGHNVERRH